jgi:hypothetical protein
MPEATTASLVRTEQTAQHPDERGLAAAVWSEKSVDLALLHLQIDPVYNGTGTEPLGHSADVND